MAKTYDICAYGYETLLQDFVKEVNLLARVSCLYCHAITFTAHLQDEGYEIEINGEMQCIYGAVILLIRWHTWQQFCWGFQGGCWVFLT